MSGSIERSGVHLAAREVQKCAHCWLLPIVLFLKSREGNSSPQTLRAQEKSGHRQVTCCNLAAEPCAIPRRQMLRGKARSRRSKSQLLCCFLVHAWQCGNARQCALLHIYLASRSVSLLFHSWAFQNAESKVELLAKNACMQSTLRNNGWVTWDTRTQCRTRSADGLWSSWAVPSWRRTSVHRWPKGLSLTALHTIYYHFANYSWWLSLRNF